MEKGLWGYVDGSEEAPVATATDTKEKEIKEYRLKSDKAYSLIALSIHKSIQIHIVSVGTPKEAWDKLKSHFEFVSVTQTVRLNRSFYASTMDENTDLMVHITHMTTLYERLREAGEDVNDKKFAIAVLGSLPESYNTFIMSLNARDANQLSWDSIKPLLIEEYMKRKDKRVRVEKPSDEALYLHQKGASSSHYGNRSNATNTRGFVGGGQRRNQNGGRRSGISSSKQCWNCQGFGHISRFCPLNKEESNICFSPVVYSEREHSNYSENYENYPTVPDVALMITNSDYLDVGDTQLDEWYIDSGASSHMCHNINAFVDYCKYEVPTKICLGDGGIIFALGQGKVRLTLLDENGIKRFVVLQTVLFVPHLSKNLISVRAMAKSGAEICFDHEKCIIVKGETKFVIGRMMANDKLYRVSPFTNVSQFVCLSSGVVA